MEETPGRASLEKLGCRTPPQLHAGGVGQQQQESLPGLWMGMTIDDFQIAGIRHDVTESLKSAVRYSIALGPRFFR